jgi:hypothetical protein
MKNILQLIAILFVCAFLSSCQKEGDLSNNSITYDADAQRFMDSSGITDSTHKSAINNLVKQLKDSSLWTKFVAVYPMVGGTATTTKWNLKDPRDLDAAYRLTYTGSPVFASTGMTPSNGNYADTHLNDNTLTYNNCSMGYYSRTSNTVNGADMGCDNIIVPENTLWIYATGLGPGMNAYFFNNGNGVFEGISGSTQGLFSVSATSGDITMYRNGVVTANAGNAPTNSNTAETILIGMSRSENSGQRECAFAYISTGLTTAETLTLYNIVQKFQTTLSRTV